MFLRGFSHFAERKFVPQGVCEVDVVRLRDYFGLRMSVSRRWGGYLSFKFSGQKREGFNADEIGEEVDVSKKTYLGRIRNSYMAGIKYGIISRDYPLYAYLGIGYRSEEHTSELQSQ